jgi:hypothetical protein
VESHAGKVELLLRGRSQGRGVPRSPFDLRLSTLRGDGAFPFLPFPLKGRGELPSESDSSFGETRARGRRFKGSSSVLGGRGVLRLVRSHKRLFGVPSGDGRASASSSSAALESCARLCLPFSSERVEDALDECVDGGRFLFVIAFGRRCPRCWLDRVVVRRFRVRGRLSFLPSRGGDIARAGLWKVVSPGEEEGRPDRGETR